ncbi:MAG: tripartite tricarboxylate transporter TctB family protein [Azospirillaceae bacterium]
MKIDDSLSGLAAILFGAFLIYWSRGFETVAHIAYGPGFFPMLIGAILIGAGTILASRRLVGWWRTGEAPRGVTLGEWARSPRAIGAFVLFLAAIVFYILAVEWLGFLLTMPIILAVLIWWLDRRPGRAIATAVVATLALQTFFQGVMTVPLPWGLLEPWAGTLTWM